ncbi:hypothetical protein D9758_004820 [Tetrapyrgos nigripes]|uniref:non-specific serine/threonine protein kinase n=1 Tax=Tetrapyrgos nigripes TaxID=182062 RepID=A0A8H5G658_9AGAR|nr:hypothetical protein D9758_004820 [Tetrapyrgos nigripes]
MLGSRTKKVNSYGKRTQRIVSVYDDSAYTGTSSASSIFDDMPPTQFAPVASKMKNRENQVVKKAKPAPVKPIPVNKKKKQQSPVAQSLRQIVLRKQEVQGTPSRTPFAVREPNTPGSPAVSGLARKRARLAGAKGTPRKPKNVEVEMDIIVLDDDGIRSVMRGGYQEGQGIEMEAQTCLRQRDRGNIAPKKKPILVSDSETDEVSPAVRKPKRMAKRANVVVSDDSDEDQAPPSPVAQPKKAVSKSKPQSVVAAPRKQPVSRVEVLIPPPSPPLAALIKAVVPSASPEPPISFSPPHQAQTQFKHPLSPLIKPRQLTPIRHRQKKLFEPPSPPSPLSDSELDFSIDLSDPNIGLHFPDAPLHEKPVIAEYLVPLLEECHQGECGLHEFSAFIETFPFDPVVRKYSPNVPSSYKFRKVGEASYSEVYGIGDVVLKVIPIRDESPGLNLSARSLKARYSGDSSDTQDGPAPSDAKDVLKEIIVTRAMGDVCENFVRLLKTYVVRGRYPQLLLKLWDEYLEKNGSESERPDTFNVSQVYAIIVLPNGGPDLETYTFSNPTKTGWRQACSIFWQVAKTLAHAEQLVSFEHRDLHWGQILIKNLPSAPAIMPRPMQEHNLNTTGRHRPTQIQAQKAVMDDPIHGIHTTIIDLGLARMDAGDGAGGEMVHWTPFDEEIFWGEGDYQFDVYRLMKKHNSNNWEGFNPLTNVMWLHYLLLKLMRSKHLKVPKMPATPRKNQNQTLPSVLAPASSNSASTLTFSERECYECLVDLEGWLAQCMNAISKAKASTKGRKKATAPAVSSNPSCAGEIVEYGVKKAWVKSLGRA